MSELRCTCFQDEHGPDCDQNGCCGQCRGLIGPTMSEADEPLKPWERLVTGMDVGSTDGDCMVVMIYDALNTEFRIFDVEYQPDQPGASQS